MKKTQEKLISGITLIALIVTIIVLLILAGVTIVTLTGENGLLTKAQIAKERTVEAEQDEKDKLSSYENAISNKGNNQEEPTFSWEKFNTEPIYVFSRVEFSPSASMVQGGGGVWVYDEYEFSETQGFIGVGERKYISQNSQGNSELLDKYIVSTQTVEQIYSVSSWQYDKREVDKCTKTENGKTKGDTTNEIVRSKDRYEYPNSGLKDDYWYEFKGIVQDD